MSIYHKISAIESKISRLEARIDGGTPNLVANPNAPNLTSGAKQSHEAVTFENLVNTLADDEKFDGGAATKAGAHKWKGDPKDFDGMIAEASTKHGVDPSLIRAVIRQESAFDPNAKSWAGAQGLMQLMPGTASDMGVKDVFNPYDNIMGGTKYLRMLMDRFDGNLTKVIAGYNAGPGNVEKHGGVPPFSETQDYVGKVLDYYQDYKQSGGNHTASL